MVSKLYINNGVGGWSAGFEYGDSLRANLINSIRIKKGRWWFRPSFGSRLHEIRKITGDSLDLARQFVLESLQWMISSNQVKEFEVQVNQDALNQRRMNIDIWVHPSGISPVRYQLWYDVV